MWLVPWDFTVTADGKLLPEARQRRVRRARRHRRSTCRWTTARAVKEGEVVAVQRSSELEEKFAQLHGRDRGEQRSGARAVEAAPRSLDLSRATATPTRLELASEIEQHRRRAHESLQEQRDPHSQRSSELRITSPIDGKVVTWKVRELLEDRPVSTGTRLMEIADPTKDWELQIDVPEAKMGHVDPPAAGAFSEQGPQRRSSKSRSSWPRTRIPRTSCAAR